jgi:surfactin family lipopeptide synthetase C
VKLRGFRVEPGEIEEALKRLPEINDAAVIVREDQPGDQRLVAYLVTPSKIPPSQIRTQLQDRLPAHMIPSAFVWLERLPLTPNGKIDRKSLPQPEASRREEDDTYIAPRTPTEELLANIWGELLKVQQVSINDNFFSLGGHSLLATKVVARLQNAFGVKIPLRKIFEVPTVEGLAMEVDEILSASTEDAELAALLAELEGMSDEEAERMLAER